jgi:hypothetical protein
MAPDAEFLPGELALLRAGNPCRLLDPRRTPGVIEKYFPECAMFRWRISAFEHEGRFWDLPAEDVVGFQFAKGATRLDGPAVAAIERAVRPYRKPLRIEPSDSERQSAEAEIAAACDRTREWLRRESIFFSSGGKLNLGSRTGPKSLARDLLAYMSSHKLREVEIGTAENIVLNPRSGEWVKGMEIVLAEMGLVGFTGTVTRTSDVFRGQGARRRRRTYLVHRLAFVRAYFSLLGIDSVTLYRGVFPDGRAAKPAGSLVSYTFNPEVARSFSEPEVRGRVESPVVIKKTVPVKDLFVTYLETEALNAEYKEAEATVLEDPRGTSR